MSNSTSTLAQRVGRTASALGLSLAVTVGLASLSDPAAAQPNVRPQVSLNSTVAAPGLRPGPDDKISRVPMSQVIASSRPLSAPLVKGPLPEISGHASIGENPVRFGGAAAQAASQSIQTQSQGVTGNVWSGAYNANPNRQVGRLYFYIAQERRWSHCSATAINSGNKSVVVTAGHCIFTADPDENGRVDGNVYAHQDFRFCPGYENGCRLGVWSFRFATTTAAWYYGVGADHSVGWADDMGILLMKPNNRGYLVNAVGGQGIAFNQAVRQTRTAMGYPEDDRRFPTQHFTGEDLIYCQSVDQLDASRSTMVIPCRMTGGASGGPWLTWANQAWGGYVNSVNSFKLGTGDMHAPYFGKAEEALFDRYRTA